MPEEEVLDILGTVAESACLVQERFSRIKVPDDLVRSSEGLTILDAITMRLQVIGESVKRIRKMDFSLLETYPEIEWEKITRFRDLVSHHYDRVDHEIVFDICKVHIPRLIAVVERMRTSLSEDIS
jgi:uncharacterized protein with HEPN domain